MKNNRHILRFLAIVLVMISLGIVSAQDDDPETETDQETPTAEPQEQAEEDTEEDPMLYRVNSETIINARNTPSTTANVSGILQPSEIVEVIEVVEGSLVSGNSIWYRINIEGQDAYVHSSLMVPASSLPNQNVILDIPDSFLPKIVVNSVGTATVTPNVAIVVFGFERIGTDAGVVFNMTETSKRESASALASADVSTRDITTSLTTVVNEDVLDSSGGITGEFVFRSRATSTVYIRDLDRLEELVSLALENGANSIINVVYTRDDFKDAENQARRDGVQRALEHALDIASESQVVLGPSVLITMSPFTVTSVQDISPLPRGVGVQAVNLLIPPKPDQITVSVEITAEYGVLVR